MTGKWGQALGLAHWCLSSSGLLEKPLSVYGKQHTHLFGLVWFLFSSLSWTSAYPTSCDRHTDLPCTITYSNELSSIWTGPCFGERRQCSHTWVSRWCQSATQGSEQWLSASVITASWNISQQFPTGVQPPRSKLVLSSGRVHKLGVQAKSHPHLLW